MTATLTPDLESLFIRQNRLVQLRIARESTNRANIRYSVQRFSGIDGLCKQAAGLVRTLMVKTESGDGEERLGKDSGRVAGGEMSRIIVYCQTLDLMEELASDLNCPTYTGDQETMTDEENDLALERWRSCSCPWIIAAMLDHERIDVIAP